MNAANILCVRRGLLAVGGKEINPPRGGYIGIISNAEEKRARTLGRCG